MNLTSLFCKWIASLNGLFLSLCQELHGYRLAGFVSGLSVPLFCLFSGQYQALCHFNSAVYSLRSGIVIALCSDS